MPITVPTYNRTRELPSAPNQLPSVRQTAAPSAAQLGAHARPTEDAIGAGMTSAGPDLMRVGLDMQAREDADSIFRAETVLKDRVRVESEKWSNRRGVQAWDVTKDAASWWDTEAVKAGEGLNERQRIAFDQTLAKMRGISLDRIAGHEANERRSSLDESAQANVVGSINFAIENADNPEAIRSSREEVVRNVNVRAGINGWTPERRALEIEKSLTAMHKQVAYSIMARDPEAAQKYLDAHKEEVSPAERREIGEKLESTTRLAKVQSFADEHGPESGLTKEEAVAKAREKFSGDDERVAVAEIKLRYAEKDQAKKDAQEKALDQAYAERGPLGSVARISPATWALLDADNKRKLIEQDEARAARVESRAAARENRAYTKEMREQRGRSLEKWSELRERLSDREGIPPTADEIRESHGKGELTDSHAADLLRYIDRNTTAAEKVDGTSYKSATAGMISGMKLNKRETAAFNEAVHAEVLADQRVKGRPLSVVEIREIADRLAVEGVVEDGGFLGIFDDKKRRFELLDDEKDRWRPGAPKGSTLVAPKQRAASAPQETKTVKGKVYVKINGQWYEQ